jgi:LPXTG-motif cell wall-anchored protein
MRRVSLFATTTLVTALLCLPAALTAAAQPGGDPPPSGDPRATSHAGNVTTCAAAGLSGQVILKDDSPTTQYLTVDPADLPAGYAVTGIVVKAGNAYNVYPPSALTELHGPLVGQGKNVPVISHWFVCGQQTEQTTTTTTTTTAATTATTATSATTSEPSDNGATTPTSSGPAAQGGVASEAELAATGVAPGVPLIAAGALLLIGFGLLFVLRRTRHRT